MLVLDQDKADLLPILEEADLGLGDGQRDLDKVAALEQRPDPGPMPRPSYKVEICVPARYLAEEEIEGPAATNPETDAMAREKACDLSEDYQLSLIVGASHDPIFAVERDSGSRALPADGTSW
jgi:hypothetical protein